MRKLVLIMICFTFFSKLTVLNTYAQGSSLIGVPVSRIKIINEYNELIGKDLKKMKLDKQVKTSSSKQREINDIINGDLSNKIKPGTSDKKKSHTLLDIPTSLLKYNIYYMIDSLRPNLSGGIKKTILGNISRKLPRGFGIHSSSNLQLGEDCNIETYFFSNSPVPTFEIEISIPHNRLFTRITTPDGYPGSLDPNFITFFDFTIRVPLSIPGNTSQLYNFLDEEEVTVEAKNISKPVTKSVTGNLAIIINDIVSIFSGNDMIANLQRDKTFNYTITNISKLIDLSSAKKTFTGLPPMRIDSYINESVLMLRATNELKMFQKRF